MRSAGRSPSWERFATRALIRRLLGVSALMSLDMFQPLKSPLTILALERLRRFGRRAHLAPPHDAFAPGCPGKVWREPLESKGSGELSTVEFRLCASPPFGLSDAVSLTRTRQINALRQQEAVWTTWASKALSPRLNVLCRGRPFS